MKEIEESTCECHLAIKGLHHHDHITMIMIKIKNENHGE